MSSQSCFIAHLPKLILSYSVWFVFKTLHDAIYFPLVWGESAMKFQPQVLDESRETSVPKYIPTKDSWQ